MRVRLAVGGQLGTNLRAGYRRHGGFGLELRVLFTAGQFAALQGEAQLRADFVTGLGRNCL
jgi:hypothetical protein